MDIVCVSLIMGLEVLQKFYAYSSFRGLSIADRSHVNINIPAPKIEAL
jgi:hypothetical protein